MGLYQAQELVNAEQLLLMLQVYVCLCVCVCVCGCVGGWEGGCGCT